MLNFDRPSRNNDQTNGNRVLSQQSNLCCDIKSYRVKNFCLDKGKLFRDRKWKSNETSQDEFVPIKISMLQAKVQLAKKIKEGNMSRHFDIENICRNNNNMQ